MKKLLIIFLFIVLKANYCLSGTFRVENIDISEYPKISADLYPYDNNGKLITDININDLKIVENRNVSDIIELDCDHEEPVENLSVIFVFDNSATMYNTPRMPVAKAIAGSMVGILTKFNIEVAVTGFDYNNYLVQDYTNDPLLLRNAINSFEEKGNVINENYKRALIDQPSGAYLLAKRAKFKPVIIVMTDGKVVSPTDFLPDLKNMAIEVNASVYGVNILGGEIDILAELAELTGGKYYYSYYDDSKSKELINDILINEDFQLEEGPEIPCKISWMNDGCEQLINGRITLNRYNLSSVFSYEVPKKALSGIELLNHENSIHFEIDGSVKTRVLKLTPRGQDIYLEEIISSSQEFRVSPIDFSLPGILNKNIEYHFRVSFTPGNEIFAYSEVEFINNSCLETILHASATGLPPNKELSVLFPNGGEQFSAGSNQQILWGGLNPERIVNVEISYDAGKKWEQAYQNLNTGIFNWDVPFVNSSECLMKASFDPAENSMKYVFPELKGNLNAISGGKFKSGFFVSSGSKILVYDYLDGRKNEIAVKSKVHFIEYSKKSGLLAYANYDTITVYDLSLNKILATYKIHESQVLNLKWNSKGTMLASVDADRRVVVYDLEYNRPQYVRELHSGWIKGLDWSRDDKYIITGGNDGNIVVSDISKRDTIHTLEFLNMTVTGITTDKTSDLLLYSLKNGEYFCYDFKQKIKHWNYKLQSEINCIQLSPNNELFALGTSSGELIICKKSSGEILNKIKVENSEILDLDWLSDGVHVAVRTYSSSIFIWRVDGINNLSDVSDNLWSITSDLPTPLKVDLGKLLLGNNISVVESLLFNNSGITALIDSVEIDYSGNNSFNLTLPLASFQLKNGESFNSEIQFEALEIGYDTASVNFHIKDKILTSQIVVEVYENNEYSLDFGMKAACGVYTDSIVILNEGQEIILDNPQIQNDENGVFTIHTSHNFPIIIPQNESKSILINFEPGNQTEAQYSGNLVLQEMTSGVDIAAKLSAESKSTKFTSEKISNLVKITGEQVTGSFKLSGDSNFESEIEIIPIQGDVLLDKNYLKINAGSSDLINFNIDNVQQGVTVYKIHLGMFSPCEFNDTLTFTVIGKFSDISYKPIIDFGEISFCENTNMDFIVYNLGDTNSFISNFNILGRDKDNFVVIPYTGNINAGDSVELIVVAIPGGKSGELYAEIHFESIDGAALKNHQTVLRANIDEINIDFTPKIEFGEVIVGSFKSNSIEIKNSGKRKISISLSLLQTDGSFILSSQDLYEEIFPGESVFPGIIFIPQLNSTYTSQLEITVNDSNCEKRYYLNLNGRGKQELTISIPHKAIDIGEIKAIPVYLHLNMADKKFVGVEYSISIEFSPYQLEILGVEKGDYSVDEGILNIAAQINELESEVSIINYIQCRALFGETHKVELNFVDEKWQWNYDTLGIPETFVPGSVTIGGICAPNLSHVRFYQPTELEVFPNPVTDEIQVGIKSSDNGEYILELIDIQGRVLAKRNWNYFDEEVMFRELKLNFSGIEKGAYFIRLIAPLSQLSKQIIKVD